MRYPDASLSPPAARKEGSASHRSERTEPTAATCELLAPTDRPELLALTRRVLHETNAQKRDRYDERYFTWQYDGGYSQNLNVVARAGGAIAGSYPNLLLPLRFFERTVTGAICQDLLTDPAHRGLGLFAAMGDVAERTLRERDVAVSYAFPNHRSISGFIKKHHHTLVAEVPLLAKPPFFPMRVPRPSPRFTFDPIGPDGTAAIDVLWRAFQKTAPIQLVRDAAFVRWRFLDAPHADYHVFVLHHDGVPVGYAALRRYRLFRMPVCLLMDFMVVSPRDHLGALLHHVERWAARNGAALVVLILLGDGGLHHAFSRKLYVTVPSRLNRRKFHLVARANLPSIHAADVADRAQWHVTFADWDVF